MRVRRSEGGWGLLVVLVALAIVAFLARDALSGYLGGATRAVGGRAAPATAATQGDARPGVPVVQAPVERARAVEHTVARGAEARAKALEDRGR